MDYALAKSLCTIGVKPAFFRSIIPQDPTLSAQSSKNSSGMILSTSFCRSQMRFIGCTGSTGAVGLSWLFIGLILVYCRLMFCHNVPPFYCHYLIISYYHYLTM